MIKRSAEGARTRHEEKHSVPVQLEPEATRATSEGRRRGRESRRCRSGLAIRPVSASALAASPPVGKEGRGPTFKGPVRAHGARRGKAAPAGEPLTPAPPRRPGGGKPGTRIRDPTTRGTAQEGRMTATTHFHAFPRMFARGPLSAWLPVALAGLFAGSALAQTTPSETTLVSNFGEASHNTEGISGSNDHVLVQRFTTGSSTYVVTAAQVDVDNHNGGLPNPSALQLRICPRISGNVPDLDNCLGTLSAPATLGTGEQEFDSTGDTINLAASSRYFLVASVDSESVTVTLNTAFTDGEESDYGWSIANNARKSSNDGATFTSLASNSVKIKILGYDTTSDPASTDATLSALELEDGDGSAVTLSPTFDAATTSYTASVANTVARITVDATENDAGAEANFFDGSDNALTDADGDSNNGFQVDLAAGANMIKVKVTAEDNDTTQTYTVVVTRADGTVLVSSLGQSQTGSATLGGPSGWSHAQKFTVASNQNAVLSDVRIALANGGGITVAIHEPAAGNADNPAASSLYDLTRTSTPDSDGLFTAPPNATLTQGASYFVVAKGPNANARSIGVTTSDGQTGQPDWDIASSRRSKTAFGSWSSESQAVRMRLRGTKTDVDSNDAALTDLDLTWDDNGAETDITLSPNFSSNGTSYTASVANGVSRITIAETKSDDNAEVDYLDGSDQSLADADSDTTNGFQVDLDVGENTIKVEVTAEDDVTTRTYTVVVTRAAAMVQTTTVTQTAGGATWTITGPAQHQAGQTHTYTIELASGTKPPK